MRTKIYKHTQFYDCSNRTFEAPCLAIMQDDGEFIDSITFYEGRLKLYGVPSFFEPGVLSRTNKFARRLDRFEEAGYSLDNIIAALSEFAGR